MDTTARCQRVLMTADAVGGVWSYVLELCGALARHGVSVTVAVMGTPPTLGQRLEAMRIPGLELEVGPYRLEWMESPWQDVAEAGQWLLELEAKYRPDVVHLNGYCHGALPFLAPKLVVGHSCVLSWFRAVKGEEAPESWRHYREAVTAGLQAADAVVAPTRAMLDELAELYGPLPAPAVIPNGRSLGPWRAGEKSPFIFAAGRVWDEAKNLSALDEAARELPWPVVVAGDTRSPAGSEVRPRHLWTLGRLTPTELSRWMGRAAVFALPARYEPFGLSPLEAALSGCALVLGDLPSLREVWDEAAVYVAPGDTSGLAAKLHLLLSNPATRERLAEKAQGRARLYTAESTGRAYLTLYRALLAHPRSRASIRGALSGEEAHA